MIRMLWAVVLVLAMALGTMALGWWAVPAAAAIWGALYDIDRGAATRPWSAAARRFWIPAACGALAWTLLLAWTALEGPVLDLAGKVGPTLGLPGPALLALTPLFAAALALSASGFAASTWDAWSKKGAVSADR